MLAALLCGAPGAASAQVTGPAPTPAPAAPPPSPAPAPAPSPEAPPPVLPEQVADAGAPQPDAGTQSGEPDAAPASEPAEPVVAPGPVSPEVAPPATAVAPEVAPATSAPEVKGAEPVEVTVVGTKLSRTAGSVHVLRSKDLERFNYDDPTRVVMSVPGVYVRNEDGFGLRPNIGIRGVNPDRSKKITLLEDGVLIAPAPYTAPAA
ncbi:MAG TPA: TonB-dependent receptor plug domain-containing protein, partial [Polyangiales bacterium]